MQTFPNQTLILISLVLLYHVGMRPEYKQTEFGKFTNDDLQALIESDPVGKEWLDLFAREIASMMNQKGFSVEGAKEFIVASIANGFYVPMFARGD